MRRTGVQNVLEANVVIRVRVRRERNLLVALGVLLAIILVALRVRNLQCEIKLAGGVYFDVDLLAVAASGDGVGAHDENVLANVHADAALVCRSALCKGRQVECD